MSDSKVDSIMALPSDRAGIANASLTENMKHVLAFADPRKPVCGHGRVAGGLVRRGLARYMPTKTHGRQRLCLTDAGLALRLILRSHRVLCDCGEIAVYEGPPVYTLGAQPAAHCKDCVPRGCSCNGPKRPCVDYWYHPEGFLAQSQANYDQMVMNALVRTAKAMEARRATTGTGVVHDSAVGAADLPETPALTTQEKPSEGISNIKDKTDG